MVQVSDSPRTGSAQALSTMPGAKALVALSMAQLAHNREEIVWPPYAWFP